MVREENVRLNVRGHQNGHERRSSIRVLVRSLVTRLQRLKIVPSQVWHRLLILTNTTSLVSSKMDSVIVLLHVGIWKRSGGGDHGDSCGSFPSLVLTTEYQVVTTIYRFPRSIEIPESPGSDTGDRFTVSKLVVRPTNPWTITKINSSKKKETGFRNGKSVESHSNKFNNLKSRSSFVSKVDLFTNNYQRKLNK